MAKRKGTRVVRGTGNNFRCQLCWAVYGSQNGMLGHIHKDHPNELKEYGRPGDMYKRTKKKPSRTRKGGRQAGGPSKVQPVSKAIKRVVARSKVLRIAVVFEVPMVLGDVEIKDVQGVVVGMDGDNDGK
jgi:hypothetical protein